MRVLKRVYEKPDQSDRFRILVDKLWPRGLSKEMAKIDLWIKEIAPSNELRKWFDHDPEKWKEFQERYRVELQEKEELLGRIRQLESEHGTITLLFSARDEEHNNAVALNLYLNN
jgi:uncharacterized protein YeaO (DUF488 family)